MQLSVVTHTHMHQSTRKIVATHTLYPAIGDFISKWETSKTHIHTVFQEVSATFLPRDTMLARYIWYGIFTCSQNL